MTRAASARFLLALALQVGVILALFLWKFVIFTSGTEVLLKIEPVDPRDLLRGDYVTFQYEISHIETRLFAYAPVKDRDTIYVPLEQTGKYWTAAGGVQKTRPREDNRIFIKGKVLSGGARVRIAYGAETYFIPEGAGRNFDFRNRTVAAKVAVDTDGNAVLKQIYVDGQPWP